MSNPAVIELVSGELECGNFRIEDNIGESIHIHISEFRFDFSVKEFMLLAEKVRNVLDVLWKEMELDCSMIDPEFLFQISDFLPDLTHIEIRNIPLTDLKVDTINKIGFPTYRSISESRVVKALKGNHKEDDKRLQINPYGMTNQERTNYIAESVRINGYPYKNKRVVLFNDEMVIRDGQHRAAALYMENPNMSIEVLCLQFSYNLHGVDKYPFLKKVFYWDKKKLKKNIKIILKFGKQVIFKIRRKLFYIRYRKKLRLY